MTRAYMTDRLKPFISDLRRLIRDYEAGIVEISESLPAIEKEIDRNLEQARYFLSLIFCCSEDGSGGIKQELDDLEAQIRSSIGNFMETDRIDKELFRDLKESIRISTASLKRIDDITDISENLKVFAINSILYSMKAGTDGKGYQVLSGEFIRLSEEIASGTSAISRLSSQADEGISGFIGLVNEYETYLGGQIEGVKATSGDLLSKTHESVRNFSMIIEDLLGRIESVKKPVWNIMTELQKQDIIQQQLIHITDAMEDILKVVEADEPAGDSSENFMERSLYTILKHLLSVVEKQLARLNTEIIEMLDGLRMHFDRMSEVINDINQDRSYILQLVNTGDNHKGPDSIVELVFRTPVQLINSIIESFEKSLVMKEEVIRQFTGIKDNVDVIKDIASGFIPRVESVKNMLVLAKIEKARYGLNITDLNSANGKGSFFQNSFTELLDIVENVFDAQRLVGSYLEKSLVSLSEERDKHRTIQNGMSSSLSIIENTEEVFIKNYEEIIGITVSIFDYLDAKIGLFNEVKTRVESISDGLSACREIRAGVERTLEELGGAVPLEQSAFKDLFIRKIVDKCTVASERSTFASEISEVKIEESTGSSITLF